MSAIRKNGKAELASLQHPVFIVVSRVVRLKGLRFLLQACSTLNKRGYSGFSLLIVGDGPQRGELERLAIKLGLRNHLLWAGWVDYVLLNKYFNCADVLIFPTLEDPWGMVVLEAMAFGKAILCSKWAGAAEMVVDGENGYVFDPYQYYSLGELMQRFLDHPELAKSMGARSKEIIESSNPTTAADFLDQVVRQLCK
jgi:glycosyltransferase involved in cell wall biosynthesis